MTKLSAKIKDHEVNDHWGRDLDSSSVHVERVLAYWSRTLKSAETRYSATEREALGAKEGLVKFQPYVEGERILLVTDHAALQWAKTYENANRRLAAWGAIYSVFAPGLEIIHRPGRIHSNVDPLSRLPRAPPEHISPLSHGSEPLRLDTPEAEEAELEMDRAPARRAAQAVTLEYWEDVLCKTANVGNRRSERLAKGKGKEVPSAPGDGGASTAIEPSTMPQGDTGSSDGNVKAPASSPPEPESSTESPENQVLHTFYRSGCKQQPKYFTDFVVIGR